MSVLSKTKRMFATGSLIGVMALTGLASAYEGGFGNSTNDFGQPSSDVNFDVRNEPEMVVEAANIGSRPLYCDGIMYLKSPRRAEAYMFRFRDSTGQYDEALMSSLHWFLRCADGTWQHMDVKVIEFLNYVSKLLGDPLIEILSAYRSPAYNAKLALVNENVAKNSLHMYGKAIDFRVAGVRTRDLCAYALAARNTLGYGGVGCYQTGGFVHIDSGPFKHWKKK